MEEALRICFNPYRVFKFAATLLDGIVGIYKDWFQSLSGFQVRCNLVVLQKPLVMARFNPYRVFKFAATPWTGVEMVELAFTRFNPYRVFKFAATLAISSYSFLRRMGFNPYRVFKFAATSAY